MSWYRMLMLRSITVTKMFHDFIGGHSQDQENMKPNSLLPIESWHKSFVGKFRTEITWSVVHEKHQTDDTYSWCHNGRHDNNIYECWYESITGCDSVCTWCCLWYNMVWICPGWQVCICGQLHWICASRLNKTRACSSECFPGICGL